MEKEGAILKDFILRTGADESKAKSVLASCHWDLELAQKKLQEPSLTSSEKRKVPSEGVESSETVREGGNASDKPVRPKERHIKIARGFSMVDPEMVSKLHSDIEMKGRGCSDESYGYFQDVARFSFTLPDFSQYDSEFVEFLMKDLVENSSLKALEDSGHLNWLVSHGQFQRLLPLATSGDGNCLLHAASLGMWGVHDRLLNLRQAVHRVLSTKLAERTIKRRWRWYQWVKNMTEGELVFTESEWEKEWQLVLSLAASKSRSTLGRQSLTTVPEISDGDRGLEAGVTDVPTPRRFSSTSQPRYESLEEVHIFSLAHVVRRPIVIIADTVLYDFEGNALFPIPFGGVYLPVECDSKECCRIPLVLAFSSGHFSPVVAMDANVNASSAGKGSGSSNETSGSEVQAVVPLVDKSLKTLPLPFAVDPGDDWDWLTNENSHSVTESKSLSSDEKMALLQKYLDVVHVNISMKPVQQSGLESKQETLAAGKHDDGGKITDDVVIPVQHSVPVVVLPCDSQPSYYKELVAGYIEKAKERFKFEQEMRESRPEFVNESVKCASDGCDMYGTVANNYLCTKCFQLQSKSLNDFKPKGWTEHSSEASSAPPSYSEVIHDNQVYYPPSLSTFEDSGKFTAVTPLSQTVPVQCPAKNCTFYGTADRNGFCSKCYMENKK